MDDPMDLAGRIREIRATNARAGFLAVKLDTPMLDKRALMTHVEAIDQMLKMASPDIKCGFCGGVGCRACKDTGYISHEQAKMHPDATRLPDQSS
jgi:hypothetical protein